MRKAVSCGVAALGGRGHDRVIVDNNPILFTDPSGLDYWVEGAVEGEGGMGMHRSVCVGNYKGKRMCISFGIDDSRTPCPNPFNDCVGYVFEDKSAAGPLIKNHYQRSSATTDQEIEKLFGSMLNTPGKYNVTKYSCRNFSEEVYQYLSKKYGAKK